MARASRQHTSTTRETMPASVWSAPSGPIDLDTSWPAPVVGQILDSFATLGENILLLPWPSRPEQHTDSAPHPALAEALQTAHARAHHAEIASEQQAAATADTADLVLTACPPHDGTEHHSTQLATTAAHRLRPGGLLAVLTHTSTAGGRLTDPTGQIVTAAQDADLLYLQHIVVLEVPIHDGTLTPPEHPTVTASSPAHQRIHADLLVFTRPGCQL